MFLKAKWQEKKQESDCEQFYTNMQAASELFRG